MIGVFDSGFGGLTVLQALLSQLPEYDYLYLGDSARSPYGARSPDVITEFTRESVERMFELGCPLVILACNTASARSLRTLQQRYLVAQHPDRRILGVVRPSAEALAGLPPGAIPGETPPTNASGTVAVLGTTGTVASGSYRLELEKLAPGLTLVQQACPLFVPLVEEGELDGPGVQHYAHRYLDPLFGGPNAPNPTKLLLGCTHYPLLLPVLKSIVPGECEIISQATIVADRLSDWLARHPWMEQRLGKGRGRQYLTTDDPVWFAEQGARFLGEPVTAEHIHVP